MQDMPTSEDLLDGSAQAPVIRMINALLLQALRERASDLHFEPYEARAGRALSRRRHAARHRRAAARAARCARVASEDHGGPRHRREAAAAGRAHRAEARRPAGRRARVDAADRGRASASCCACSTRMRRASISPTLGMSGDTLDDDRRADPRSRTASCSSRARPARARRRRSTPGCRGCRAGRRT